jgi:hypothetical protein
MKRVILWAVSPLCLSLPLATTVHADVPDCHGRVSCLYRLGGPELQLRPPPSLEPDQAKADTTMAVIGSWVRDVEGRRANVEAATAELERLVAQAPTNVGIDTTMDGAVTRQLDIVMAAKEPLFDNGLSILKAAFDLLILNRTLKRAEIEPFVKQSSAAASRATALANRAQAACVKAALRPLDPATIRRALGE